MSWKLFLSGDTADGVKREEFELKFLTNQKIYLIVLTYINKGPAFEFGKFDLPVAWIMTSEHSSMIWGKHLTSS